MCVSSFQLCVGVVAGWVQCILFQPSWHHPDACSGPVWMVVPSLSPLYCRTKANDGEKTKSVHLRRHGVDIGQAMKTGALYWRTSGNEVDLHNPYTALMWSEEFLHMADGMYLADEEVRRVT